MHHSPLDVVQVRVVLQRLWWHSGDGEVGGSCGGGGLWW